MQKLLALIMAALLLLSTTGVTVASVVCEQTGKPVKMCRKCEHAHGGISISARSCCVVSAHRIAVKDSFAQPAQPATFVPVATAAIASSGVALSGPQRSALGAHTLSPPSAREYCALASSFRI